MGLLNFEEAAEMLGCTPRMVRKLVETRQLASVKVGRLVRVHPDDIDTYVRGHRRPVMDTSAAYTD